MIFYQIADGEAYGFGFGIERERDVWGGGKGRWEELAERLYGSWTEDLEILKKRF
jgi:hypothetical protein